MTNKSIKKVQYRNFLLVLLAVALSLLLVYRFLEAKEVVKRDNQSANNKFSEVKFAPKTRPDELQDWIARMQNKINKNEAVVTNLATKIDTVIAEKNVAQEEKFIKLTADIEELKKTKLAQNVGLEIREDYIPLLETKAPEASSDTKSLNVKNPDNYVPAGSFVQAIMLGGADASAGALGKANPNPVLLRITEEGTLPNNKHSHLKGCLVTAAIVGDVSSERGLMRLERMSCTRPNGTIIDLEVEGTVFGTEGKNGVRGKPLWREGALLLRAAAAGTFSGFSKGLSQSLTTESISPLGSTQTVSSGDILKYSAAQGVGNAMDKLADYNIKRAEQYHPVIQIGAGTMVDIVFLKGFSLEENTGSEGSAATGKDYGANTSSEVIAGPNPLTISQEQMARIKAHEEASGIR